jgi:hypothetical protein
MYIPAPALAVAPRGTISTCGAAYTIARFAVLLCGYRYGAVGVGCIKGPAAVLTIATGAYALSPVGELKVCTAGIEGFTAPGFTNAPARMASCSANGDRNSNQIGDKSKEVV